MVTRIITAIVACALLIPVLIFADTPALPIAISIFSVVAIYEMMACIGQKKAYVLNTPLYLIALGMPFVIRYASSTDASLIRQVALTAALVIVLYFFAVLTFSHGKYKIADVGISFMTVFYIIAGFNSILFLHDFESFGAYVYLLAFIGAWVTDTFAYFCGMLLGRGGKHKLIPDVSPKKTWEGSIGGTVFCIGAMILFGFIISKINASVAVNYVMLAIAGLFVSIVSQIGDLCMSVIKRTYGIKDYGKLFPGHGGMLDRFDSVLAVSVVLAVFCSYFNFFEVI